MMGMDALTRSFTEDEVLAAPCNADGKTFHDGHWWSLTWVVGMLSGRTIEITGTAVEQRVVAENRWVPVEAVPGVSR